MAAKGHITDGPYAEWPQDTLISFGLFVYFGRWFCFSFQSVFLWCQCNSYGFPTFS